MTVFCRLFRWIKHYLLLMFLLGNWQKKFHIYFFLSVNLNAQQSCRCQGIWDNSWPSVRVLFPIIGNFNPFSIETFKKRENIKIDKKKQGKTDTTSIYLSNICNQLWTMFAANGRSFFWERDFWFHFVVLKIIWHIPE